MTSPDSLGTWRADLCRPGGKHCLSETRPQSEFSYINEKIINILAILSAVAVLSFVNFSLNSLPTKSIISGAPAGTQERISRGLLQ